MKILEIAITSISVPKKNILASISVTQEKHSLFIVLMRPGFDKLSLVSVDKLAVYGQKIPCGFTAIYFFDMNIL